jgi:hypothetical protein
MCYNSDLKCDVLQLSQCEVLGEKQGRGFTSSFRYSTCNSNRMVLCMFGLFYFLCVCVCVCAGVQSSSSLPIVSCVGAKGFHEASLATSVRCQPLHLPPRPSFSLCLFHNWLHPGLLWSSSLPRTLGVTIQHNPLNCILVLRNSMPYPLPFSFFNL